MSESLRQAWIIIRNDLRLTFREFRARRWGAFLGTGVLALLLLILSGLSILLFHFIAAPPERFVLGLIWGAIGFMMFGSAVNHSVTLLCERADFDLLLSSPLPARTLLFARMTSVVLAALLGSALIAVPFVLGLTVGVSWIHGFGLVAWLLVALLVSTLSMSFGLGLVKLLGIRRARIVIQVVGALIGAFAYLATQAHHLIAAADGSAALRILDVFLRTASLESVARAAQGDWLWLALLAGGAVGATVLGLWTLERSFLRGAQDGGEHRSGPVRRSRFRFRTGLTWATVRKDSRLILRDPLLLSQLLPPMLYMVPGVFALTRQPGLNTLAPLVLAVGIQTASILAVVAAHGEEAWDLIQMSPTEEIKLRLGKAIAACVGPALLITALSLFIFVQGRLLFGLFTWLLAVVNAGAMAWLNVSRVEPRPRGTLMRRQGRRKGGGIGAVLLGTVLAISGSLGLAMMSHPSLLPRVIGLSLIGVNLLMVACCAVLVEPRAVVYENAEAKAA